MPFAQDSLIRLRALECLALAAAVSSPARPGRTQREEQLCGRLYEALYLEINLPVVLLTPSDYAALPVK